MLTEQRYETILRMLDERGSVTVTELKDLLDASESTVRRDITALGKAGRLIKVFGGAVAMEHIMTGSEPTVAQKVEVNKDRVLCSWTDRTGRLYFSGCRYHNGIHDGLSGGEERYICHQCGGACPEAGRDGDESAVGRR